MPTWFRFCLLATAILNLAGAIFFALPIFSQAAASGLPQLVHPLYLWLISAWILLFGVAYGWMALTAKPERLFIAVAAGAKLTVAICFFAFWLMGDLPLSTVLVGSADLFFAIVFLYWLWQSRRSIKASDKAI